MKHSELRDAVVQTFGSAYGRSLLADLVLVRLDGRTPDEALAHGAAPQAVWDALCREMELDEAVRWRHRGTIPGPRR